MACSLYLDKVRKFRLKLNFEPKMIIIFTKGIKKALSCMSTLFIGHLCELCNIYHAFFYMLFF